MSWLIDCYQWLVSNYVIDSWSMTHALFWGSMVMLLPKKTPFWQVLFLAVFTGYMWEICEMNLEDIFQRQYRETFLNRWISDPLFDILGASIYYIRRKHMK